MELKNKEEIKEEIRDAAQTLVEASKERTSGNYYGAGEMEYEAEKRFLENIEYLAPSADSGELWGEVLKLSSEMWEAAELEME